MIDKLAWRFCLKVRWRSLVSQPPSYHDELLIIFAKLERFRVHRWSICTIVVFSAIRSLQTNESNCEIMNADFVRRSDTPNKTDESDSLRAFVVWKGEAKREETTRFSSIVRPSRPHLRCRAAVYRSSRCLKLPERSNGAVRSSTNGCEVDPVE